MKEIIVFFIEGGAVTENEYLRLCEQNNQTLLDSIKNESSFGGIDIVSIFLFN